MYKVYLLGIDSLSLDPRQKGIVTSCGRHYGSRRFAPLLADLSLDLQAITPLKEAFANIEKDLAKTDITVFASGDPLFYGIAKRMIEHFGGDRIEIHPALSSIQMASSQFNLPWDDAKIISLHGRSCDYDHLPATLLCHHKTFVLTDGTNTPDKISRSLLAYFRLIDAEELAGQYDVMVAEDIGYPGQHLFQGSLVECSQQSFSKLNVLCITSKQMAGEPLPGFAFGLNEQEISHSRGLITKNEVRAATLHRLQLPSTGVFWDLGAGSGSLSIEAARLNPELTVYAVERKEEELENIKTNIVRYRCFNIIPVAGYAPEALTDLPDPDRVFVGGSGGMMEEIVKTTANRIRAEGLLVINGVIEKTVSAAPRLMRASGFTVSESEIRVTRTDSSGETVTFNPITIMTGRL